MLGLESMFLEMLKQQGIDPEKLKAQIISAYNQADHFVSNTNQSFSQLINIAQSILEMQRVNAAKLDAITSHLGISLDVEKTDGQARIEFHQQ